MSTWEPVSDVFLYAKRRAAKALMALRLKADRFSADFYSDSFAFMIMLWIGGVLDFELHVFSFAEF